MRESGVGRVAALDMGHLSEDDWTVEHEAQTGDKGIRLVQRRPPESQRLICNPLDSIPSALAIETPRLSFPEASTSRSRELDIRMVNR